MTDHTKESMEALAEHAAHWDYCPICSRGLDTGLQCDSCGYDMMPISNALSTIDALIKERDHERTLKESALADLQHYSDQTSAALDRQQHLEKLNISLQQQLAAAQADAERMREFVAKAVEFDGGVTYASEDQDEIGTRTCCGIISYKSHKDDCWVPKAKAALDAVRSARVAEGDSRATTSGEGEKL